MVSYLSVPVSGFDVAGPSDFCKVLENSVLPCTCRISLTYLFCLNIIAEHDTCNTITKQVQHGSQDEANVFVHVI